VCGNYDSPPVLNGVRVTRSLVLYVCVVCPFPFDHCVFTPLVSSNSTYRKKRVHHAQDR
jgi:hypothetical protein